MLNSWSVAGQSRRRVRRPGRLVAAQIVALCMLGCQRGNPSGPSGATASGAEMSGRVVSSRDGQGLAGARVEIEGHAPAETDASGLFRVAGAGAGRRALITAAGHLTRETSLKASLTIDLISLSPPFAVDFYRELARNATGSALQPLQIWDDPPSYFVRTVDREGRPVSPTVVALVVRVVNQMVVQTTDGRLAGLAVESGPEPPVDLRGWVDVEFTSDPEYALCGEALVGTNPGRILLSLNDSNDCGLGTAPSPGCIAHEVGHTLGLWHISVPGLMQSTVVAGATCASGRLTPIEEHHASIMYSRSRHNTDVDVDPSPITGRTRSRGAAVVARCPLVLPG